MTVNLDFRARNPTRMMFREWKIKKSHPRCDPHPASLSSVSPLTTAMSSQVKCVCPIRVPAAPTNHTVPRLGLVPCQIFLSLTLTHAHHRHNCFQNRLPARVGDARRLVRCHFVNPHGRLTCQIRTNVSRTDLGPHQVQYPGRSPQAAATRAAPRHYEAGGA